MWGWKKVCVGLVRTSMDGEGQGGQRPYVPPYLSCRFIWKGSHVTGLTQALIIQVCLIQVTARITTDGVLASPTLYWVCVKQECCCLVQKDLAKSLFQITPKWPNTQSRVLPSALASLYSCGDAEPHQTPSFATWKDVAQSRGLQTCLISNRTVNI